MNSKEKLCENTRCEYNIFTENLNGFYLHLIENEMLYIGENANKNTIKLAKGIVLKELQKYNLKPKNEVAEVLAKHILSIAYAIGSSYQEKEIGKICNSLFMKHIGVI